MAEEKSSSRSKKDDEGDEKGKRSRESDDEKSGQRGRGDKGDDKDDNGGTAGGRDLALRAYLKLAATIFVTLILFAAILRGCAACQQKNPITGEPTQQIPPPPPPGG